MRLNEAGALLVTISTDYVFDGSASTPYAVDHPPRPVSAYGRTKAAGEWAVRAEAARHLILRTAWLYGAHGPCFPRTIARVARERDGVDVVTDQVGQPTWTRDVADLAERLVTAGVEGTHHATAGGQASWFDFAVSVCASAGLREGIVGRTTSEHFERPAPRPAYSVLSHDSLLAAGVEPIGDWQERWGWRRARCWGRSRRRSLALAARSPKSDVCCSITEERRLLLDHR